MSRFIILLIACWTIPVHAGKMIVFGDSLSDSGGIGRFTDPGGDLWHEYLAEELGIERANPAGFFGFGGLNFALRTWRGSGFRPL